MGRSEMLSLTAFETASRIGASSMIIWAFVPLAPNELTPAIRGLSERGQGVGSVGITTGTCFH